MLAAAATLRLNRLCELMSESNFSQLLYGARRSRPRIDVKLHWQTVASDIHHSFPVPRTSEPVITAGDQAASEEPGYGGGSLGQHLPQAEGPRR